VDIEVNNLHISRITIKDLMGYVYIVRIDVCVLYDSKKCFIFSCEQENHRLIRI
jgi:hypothetical protein